MSNMHVRLTPCWSIALKRILFFVGIMWAYIASMAMVCSPDSLFRGAVYINVWSFAVMVSLAAFVAANSKWTADENAWLRSSLAAKQMEREHLRGTARDLAAQVGYLQSELIATKRNVVDMVNACYAAHEARAETSLRRMFSSVRNYVHGSYVHGRGVHGSYVHGSDVNAPTPDAKCCICLDDAPAVVRLACARCNAASCAACLAVACVKTQLGRCPVCCLDFCGVPSSE